MKIRRHTVYVDQCGRRVPPPAGRKAAAGSRTAVLTSGSNGGGGGTPAGVTYVAPACRDAGHAGPAERAGCSRLAAAVRGRVVGAPADFVRALR